jgi:MFS family permease
MFEKANGRTISEVLILLVLALVSLIALAVDVSTHVNNTNQVPDWPSFTFIISAVLACLFWLWIADKKGSLQMIIMVSLGLMIFSVGALVLILGSSTFAGACLSLMLFGLVIGIGTPIASRIL